MKTAITNQSIVDAVVSAYLETGSAVTATEIADALKCNIAAVRALFAASHGLIPGIDCREEHRPSYSRMRARLKARKALRASRAASVDNASATVVSSAS